ncbi:MAG: acyl-CoA transferase [Rhodovulum sulfidophilum]|uniref:Acyl-CoA transferase n=1 Tax=Rhodovulum sulfidophilum TaxID=35806 RepID=A0A2W5MZC3_RHOSU|nr:MAG: acyl-CoA transferase [Rhodovulum sulfidophilum]
MRVIVLGGNPELIIYADLMEKCGAEVEIVADPDPAAPPEGPVDVLAFSSDTLAPTLIEALSPAAGCVLCDIAGGTDAFAASPDLLSEYEMQAATGLVDTTGFPGLPPTRSRVPFIALSTALYAASATLAAQAAPRADDAPRHVSASRLLTALNALTTYLPAALLGGDPSRIGNNHPASAPWNGYPTADGWILICTSKDDQWNRLRDATGDAALCDPRFDLHADRITRREELDALIADWTRAHSTTECVRALERVSIPVGPILTMGELFDDPNFALRQPAARAVRGDTGAVARAISLFRKTALAEALDRAPAPPVLRGGPAGPLEGLRVVELGQFTTAPLAGRHLAALGADVLKVEPAGGEPARQWAPLVGGVSHYFTITNTGKRIEKRNLRDPANLAWLKEQIRDCHVLVENMRPGVLAGLGLSSAELRALNPGLVLCGVSGFGAYGAYPGRAAYDTVIQGMSGMMDLTRGAGGPVKVGISAADILGAQVALLAILAALCGPDSAGGRFIDISMQDVAAYATTLSAIGGLGREYESGDARPARSVKEIARSARFRALATEVPDDAGNMRVSVVLPYRLERPSIPAPPPR